MKPRLLLTVSTETAHALTALAWAMTDQEVASVASSGSQEDLVRIAGELFDQNKSGAIVLVESFQGFNNIFGGRWRFYEGDTHVVIPLEWNPDNKGFVATDWQFHIFIKQDNFYGRMFSRPD